VYVVHQTGEADYEKVKHGYEAASWGDHSDVRGYIDDMMREFSKSGFGDLSGGRYDNC